MSRLFIKNAPVGECPVCCNDMEHLSDEYEGDNHEDSYTCDNCCLIVTYITQGSKEYHEYDEIEIQLERQLGCWGEAT